MQSWVLRKQCHSHCQAQIGGYNSLQPLDWYIVWCHIRSLKKLIMRGFGSSPARQGPFLLDYILLPDCPLKQYSTIYQEDQSAGSWRVGWMYTRGYLFQDKAATHFCMQFSFQLSGAFMIAPQSFTITWPRGSVDEWIAAFLSHFSLFRCPKCFLCFWNSSATTRRHKQQRWILTEGGCAGVLSCLKGFQEFLSFLYIAVAERERE